MRLKPDQVGVAFWLAACLFALWRGGRPERIVALALLVDLAVVELLADLSPGDAVHWLPLFGDVLVFGAMVAIQRRHHRGWLLTAIGFQLIGILAHVPRLLDPGIRRWAYVAVTNYAGYAVILALLAGAILNTLRPGARSNA